MTSSEDTLRRRANEISKLNFEAGLALNRVDPIRAHDSEIAERLCDYLLNGRIFGAGPSIHEAGSKHLPSLETNWRAKGRAGINKRDRVRVRQWVAYALTVGHTVIINSGCWSVKSIRNRLLKTGYVHRYDESLADPEAWINKRETWDVAEK